MKKRTKTGIGTVGAVALMIGVGSCASGGESTSTYPQVATEPAVEAAETSEKEAVEDVEKSLTKGQENALRAAESYLGVMAFSKSGLVEQLGFDGYETVDAEWAVENVEADWNEQAVRSAESYLETMAFSRDGLIDQLEFDGYTHEQAVHAVDEVGL